MSLKVVDVTPRRAFASGYRGVLKIRMREGPSKARDVAIHSDYQPRY